MTNVPIEAPIAVPGTDNRATQLCLTLLCPPAFEERLLDGLLMMSQVAIFTSTAASAHGLQHHRLSANEQVLGLALMTQVQALVSEQDCATVLTTLKQQLRGSGLQYWLTPVLEAGEFA